MKRVLSAVILLLCTGGFLLGLLQIFAVRFETGDAYPEYSSLRADPFGTLALYEALEKLPGTEVRRDFSDTDKLPEDTHSTYFHINAPLYELSSLTLEQVREVENFVTAGGRLVITLHSEKGRAPSARMTRTADGTDPATQSRGQMRRPSRATSLTGSERVSRDVSLEERWGLHLNTSGIEEIGSVARATICPGSNLALAPTIEWRSYAVLTNLDNRWSVIYELDAHPVLVERRFGSGSVVVATDSYFLSNEALHQQRNATLMAWLLGPHRKIVFDEAHLGLTEETGVSTLLRRYRLGGVLAVSLLIAGLFIWKNSCSLVPPLAEQPGSTAITGKEAAAGFINLLRRNVPVNQVLGLCFTEWKKSHPKSRGAQNLRVQRAEEFIQSATSSKDSNLDPVAGYREVTTILKGT